jgi:hypothetical protein
VSDYAQLWTLVGTVLGGGIGYLSAKGIANHTARLQAGSKLRATFAPELTIARTTPLEHWHSLERLLDPKPKSGPKEALDELLLAAFQRHAIAVEEYRFYVPATARAAYEDAWRAYYEEEKEEGRVGIGFLRYTARDGGPSLCCQRMEAISGFTFRLPLWERLRARIMAWHTN